MYDDINQTQGGYLVEGGSFALPKEGGSAQGISGDNAFFAQRDKIVKSGANKKKIGGSFLSPN